MHVSPDQLPALLRSCLNPDRLMHEGDFRGEREQADEVADRLAAWADGQYPEIASMDN